MEEDKIELQIIDELGKVWSEYKEKADEIAKKYNFELTVRLYVEDIKPINKE